MLVLDIDPGGLILSTEITVVPEPATLANEKTSPEIEFFAPRVPPMGGTYPGGRTLIQLHEHTGKNNCR